MDGIRPGSDVRSPRTGHNEQAAATLRYLMYVLLPSWFVPGVLDWWLHRRTRIEQTSGTRESALHLVMMAEVGAPLLMALVLEINPGMLALMGGAAAVHEATAVWDVRMADRSTREVRSAEQNVHSFLEALPFMAVAAVACLHPGQVRALLRTVGRRSGHDGTAGWRPRLKRPALPRRYLIGVSIAIGLFGLAPYVEEYLRCRRAGRPG